VIADRSVSDEQRIVLISGASAGIGRAMALAFAARGDHVVIADIVEDKGRDTAAEITAHGGSFEFHRLEADHIPLQRVGEPADIADVALFLCSHSARYITGQSIIVDGGLSIASY
jgi:NAD(P)-dependent dehydrogenase (short-subunit alcohol dehydrogenase family)